MLYLGVDLGGTNIKAALVNSEGEILCEANTPTNLPRPAEAVCDDIAALCLQLAEGKDVAGVGVGCPGTVDGGERQSERSLEQFHDAASLRAASRRFSSRDWRTLMTMSSTRTNRNSSVETALIFGVMRWRVIE